MRSPVAMLESHTMQLDRDKNSNRMGEGGTEAAIHEDVQPASSGHILTPAASVLHEQWDGLHLLSPQT